VLVVDASAIVGVLVADAPPVALVERLRGRRLHAPHLVDVEFLHAIRRLVAGGRVGVDRAASARADFGALDLVRYPHGLLLDRMWDLCDNLTAYDAAFVALAERLGVPLVTCDAGLANPPGNSAEIELYEGDG
jgi:predicted nucleic acid-binding protein